jgi:hypothetical protein
VGRYPAGVARTADGRTWTIVDAPANNATIGRFVAIDATNAVSYVISARPVTDPFDTYLRVTRDGGATWTDQPLPRH